MAVEKWVIRVNNIDKLYKLYNVANQKNDYIGNCTKVPCKLHNELGLFKLPLRYGSKDHIMEVFCYNLSKISNADVVYAEVMQTHLGIGAFSRYEIPQGYGFIHAGEIYSRLELFAQELVYMTKDILGVKGLAELCKILQFDFLVGQIDRHLQNIAFLTKKSKIVRYYGLYDNGLCLNAHLPNDVAIQCLNSGYYAGRMGDTDDLLEAIGICREFGVRSSINILNLNEKSLRYLFHSSDKFMELNRLRIDGMIFFILHQKSRLEREGLI